MISLTFPLFLSGSTFSLPKILTEGNISPRKWLQMLSVDVFFYRMKLKKAGKEPDRRERILSDRKIEDFLRLVVDAPNLRE
jgi:hypothetical protein